MTNYEKYKDEIIDMVVHEKCCVKLLKLAGCENRCGNSCSVCEEELRQWLEAEAPHLV